MVSLSGRGVVNEGAQGEQARSPGAGGGRGATITVHNFLCFMGENGAVRKVVMRTSRSLTTRECFCELLPSGRRNLQSAL